jgi:serum/glucocorticoid-regulated kinase 2
VPPIELIPKAVVEQDAKNEIKSLVEDCKVNFESFEVIKVLGSGAFGKVFLVRKKDDNRKFAMKALKKRNLIIKKQLKYAVTEANVLKSCNHPFILGLHYAFQTPNYLYLVLDFCPGGDLSYHLAQRTKFSEDEARFFIAELISAIDYLHL